VHELRERQDDVMVAVEGLADLVADLRADVVDGRPWGDGERIDLVDRLGALVDDLRA
jgi:hypothetical protein